MTSHHASIVAADPFGDVESPPFATAGPYAAWVLRRYCSHAKGEWFGQPLVLERWQRWMLNEVFRVDPKTDLRQWRNVLLLVPRKNAKSTTIAGLGYLFLLFDDLGPEVYSAAWGEQQARNVFDAARTMWDASPELRRRTKRYARSITCPSNAGAWRVVSKLAELQQGTNPSAALIDELHVHQRGDLVDAFRRGQQARRQGMLLSISTEGARRQSVLGDMQAGFLERGELEEVTPYLQVARDYESRSLMIRWGVPWGVRLDELDLENPELVRGCNPAGWLDPERLVTEFLHAPGARERDYARYHLNALVEDDGEGIAASSWDALQSDERSLVPGQDVWLGVDVGIRDDCSAIVAMGRVEGGLHVDATVLTPPADVEAELDLEDVDAAVHEYASRYRVRGIVADPFLAAQLMQGWAKRGMTVREFRFSPTQTGPASMYLLGIIESGELSHDGHEQLREHVLNMRMAERGTYWRFDKPADRSLKVDAGMALMMAASEFMEGDVYDLAGGLQIV